MRLLRRPLATLAVLASVTFLAACGSEDSSSTDAASDETTSAAPTESSSDASEPAAGTGVSCDYPADAQGASKEVEPPPAEATVSGQVAVTISTSIGDLKATLDADAAPCTVNSFVSLAEQGYYDGTSCHRLVNSPGFAILQCGDPTGTSSGGPGYTIADEVAGDETYPAATLAMAKTPAPDSGGSQFFICFADTELPPEYTVFGTLDEASNQLVVDAAADGTEDGATEGRPKTPVDFESITVS